MVASSRLGQQHNSNHGRQGLDLEEFKVITAAALQRFRIYGQQQTTRRKKGENNRHSVAQQLPSKRTWKVQFSFSFFFFF
jgi:hypothetical protein